MNTDTRHDPSAKDHAPRSFRDGTFRYPIFRRKIAPKNFRRKFVCRTAP